MENRIYKYELNTGDTVLELPKGAEILSIQSQFGEPVLWALVNPNLSIHEKRTIEAFPTGFRIDPCVSRKFIASVQFENGSFVLHYFERLPKSIPYTTETL